MGRGCHFPWRVQGLLLAQLPVGSHALGTIHLKPHISTQQANPWLQYHDHAAHITAENAYFGQAGVYLLHDPAEDALGLPSGYGEFDIPIVLTSRFYNQDGTLRSTDTEDRDL
jgi:hypothetical protein